MMAKLNGWLTRYALRKTLYFDHWTNKRVRYLAVSKEFPWDISEVIWDKHGINKNIPGLGPQKKYSSRATSAAEKACLVEWPQKKYSSRATSAAEKACLVEWPLTDACANEIPNSCIQVQSHQIREIVMYFVYLLLSYYIINFHVIPIQNPGSIFCRDILYNNKLDNVYHYTIKAPTVLQSAWTKGPK